MSPDAARSARALRAPLRALCLLILCRCRAREILRPREARYGWVLAFIVLRAFSMAMRAARQDVAVLCFHTAQRAVWFERRGARCDVYRRWCRARAACLLYAQRRHAMPTFYMLFERVRCFYGVWCLRVCDALKSPRYWCRAMAARRRPRVTMITPAIELAPREHDYAALCFFWAHFICRYLFARLSMPLSLLRLFRHVAYFFFFRLPYAIVTRCFTLLIFCSFCSLCYFADAAYAACYAMLMMLIDDMILFSDGYHAMLVACLIYISCYAATFAACHDAWYVSSLIRAFPPFTMRYILHYSLIFMLWCHACHCWCASAILMRARHILSAIYFAAIDFHTPMSCLSPRRLITTPCWAATQRHAVCLLLDGYAIMLAFIIPATRVDYFAAFMMSCSLSFAVCLFIMPSCCCYCCCLLPSLLFALMRADIPDVIFRYCFIMLLRCYDIRLCLLARYAWYTCCCRLFRFLFDMLGYFSRTLMSAGAAYATMLSTMPDADCFARVHTPARDVALTARYTYRAFWCLFGFVKIYWYAPERGVYASDAIYIILSRAYWYAIRHLLMMFIRYEPMFTLYLFFRCLCYADYAPLSTPVYCLRCWCPLSLWLFFSTQLLMRLFSLMILPTVAQLRAHADSAPSAMRHAAFAQRVYLLTLIRAWALMLYATLRRVDEALWRCCCDIYAH